MGQLDAVWRHSRLSLSTKLRLYTSLVQSVYGSDTEAWTLKQDDEKRVKAFHVKAQRRILQVNWYDFIGRPFRPMLSDRCRSCLSCLWRWRKRLDGSGCHFEWR